MESIITSAYITLLFVILSFLILESPASHVGVEPLESPYLAEFLWYGNVTREIRSEYHVCHIIRVKPRYSRSDGGKKEFFFRMFVGKMPQVGQMVYQIFFCDFLHILIQRWNGIGFSLYSFGLSHDCTEFLYCQFGRSTGMIAVHITAKNKYLILFKFLNVIRGKFLFHIYITLIDVPKKESGLFSQTDRTKN